MNRFLSWIRVLRFDYARVPSISSTFDAVLLACLWCLRIYMSVSRVAVTPPLLTTLTVYLSCGTWIGFLGLCGVCSFVFPGACAPIPLTVPAPVLVVALRSVAEVAAFSPIMRFLSLFWGFSVIA